MPDGKYVHRWPKCEVKNCTYQSVEVTTDLQEMPSDLPWAEFGVRGLPHPRCERHKRRQRTYMLDGTIRWG